MSKAAVVEKLHSTITTTVGKKDNIILWNKEQLTINSYKNAKQLIICGPFGSGKTVLLKEKANEVAEKLKKEKILQEKKGEVQQHPPANVHFLTLRQVYSNTITLDTKVENNIHAKLLEKELGEGIKFAFFWTLLELLEYIEAHSSSDHFFLDEFSLSQLSKVI